MRTFVAKKLAQTPNRTKIDIRMKRLGTTLLLMTCLGCASTHSGKEGVEPFSFASTVASSGERFSMFWEETFEEPLLDWVTPSGHDSEVPRVFRVKMDGGENFLRARHDARPEVGSAPPAIHWGKTFRDSPVPLERIDSLRWRWRVHQHPAVQSDPWVDLAASVYVVTKMPGLFPGRGFKFGWLAKPGPAGGKQRGLIQVPLRSGAPLGAWQEEEIRLCELFQRHFGACEGESLIYVGVVTDADNTRSVAEADYADFELLVRD